ncbi:3D domain-containing protein [Anaerospora hongkongensis]|uniref:3D domain-containing protein n=1 Tax=Anaerospora hongkongensis TaxID=244830 RepID=UPI002896A4B8|nr:3D domain-containing protein [Anaerospora hongkongensis]
MVSILMILAIIGYAVAILPPAQQPTPDKESIYLADKIGDKRIQTSKIKLKDTFIATEATIEETKGTIYTVTAYDLSVESCGKPVGHPLYGTTASGYSLAGHTWYSARSIAVDPRYIPLGAKVLINFFDDKFKKYDGIYTARDTGSAIKGHNIDFFMGDFRNAEASNVTWAFGKRQAKVIVLNT